MKRFVAWVYDAAYQFFVAASYFRDCPAALFLLYVIAFIFFSFSWGLVGYLWGLVIKVLTLLFFIYLELRQ